MRWLVNIYFRLPLRLKLALLTAIPLIVLLALLRIFATYQAIAQTKAATVDVTSSVLRALAQDFERIQLLQEQSAATDTVQRLRSFSDIRRVHVVAPDGTIIFSYAAPGVTPLPPPLPLAAGHRFSDGAFELVEPLNLGDGQVSLAYVETSVDRVRTHIRQAIESSFYALLGVVAVGLLSATLLQNLITRPILKIANFVREAADESRPPNQISVSDRAELLTLAHGINELLSRIRVRELCLKEVNATLQQQVDQRTRDLKLALASAEAASRAKSDFLANMSHEIRTPMTAILGYAEVLLDPVLSMQQRSDAIATITRNGEHLLCLINDILDLSKVEAGKMTVESISCSPLQIMEEVRELMADRAASKGLALRVEPVFPIPQSIQSDPVRLRQVLVNLVGNAIKFTERGSVLLRVSCDGLESLRFDVVDTGVGIPQEVLAKLFQPFTQADQSTNRRFGGTGLGLTISRRLTELLGGQLTVQSAPNQGSTFTATIRCGMGAPMLTAAPAAPAEASAEAPTTDLTGARILLAEDGPDNQRLIAHHLKKAGALVSVVENGRLAVEAVADQSAADPFDLILMDMQMPEMDGYQATRALRQAGCAIPIIALTAHAMAGDRAKCEAAGCDDYVSKPIDRSGLLATLGRHLHGAAAAV